jgi:hypothetical protein
MNNRGQTKKQKKTFNVRKKKPGAQNRHKNPKSKLRRRM